MIINKLVFSICFLLLSADFLHAQNVNSRIVVSPQYLVFYAVEGSVNTMSQMFIVSNGGSGTLNFSINNPTVWVAVDTTSGSVSTNNTIVTVTVNPAGLTTTSSPYIGDITISNGDVPQDTKKVRVE